MLACRVVAVGITPRCYASEKQKKPIGKPMIDVTISYPTGSFETYLRLIMAQSTRLNLAVKAFIIAIS
ncbi:MAG: hypothetical protein AAB660_01795 [Patescibacteria group bacterium]